MTPTRTKTEKRKATRARKMARQRAAGAAKRNAAEAAREYHSIIAHQPDDRPHMILKSHSWVSVPPTVERTSRKSPKPSYMDTVTARFDNSREALLARHTAR